jgi:hypothetical protein
VKVRSTYVGAAVVAAVLMGTASTAAADPAVSDAADVAAVVAQATADLPSVDEVAAKATAEGFVSTGDVAVTIPASADGVIQASRDGAGATVTVGTGAGSTAAGTLVGDGTVVYVGADEVSQSVQATRDGFRLHTVIEGATAPKEFRHTVGLPSGGVSRSCQGHAGGAGARGAGGRRRC